MRPQQNRRIRGRGNNNNSNNNNNRRGPNPLTRNYESNGPDVKIRGNAQHIADKYAALARDVMAAGDRVMAENYLQHAEHYMRIILSAQPQFVQPPRPEADFNEGEADNIVDLPIDLSSTNPDKDEDNHLQLVVHQSSHEEVEESGAESEAVTIPISASVKTERPRRITRRRLPRQEIQAELAAEDAVVAAAALTSSPVIPALLSDEPASEEPKPRRRRRVVKPVDEAAVIE